MTKNGKIILSSKFAVSDSKESKFVKQQEASGLSSRLEIKSLLEIKSQVKLL